MAGQDQAQTSQGANNENARSSQSTDVNPRVVSLGDQAQPEASTVAAVPTRPRTSVAAAQPDISALLQSLMRQSQEAELANIRRHEESRALYEEMQSRMALIENAQAGIGPANINTRPQQRVRAEESPHSAIQETARQEGQTTNVHVEPSSESIERSDDQASMMKAMQEEMVRLASQLHHATSAAPEIDRMLERTCNTPFTGRLLATRVQHTVKIKCPTFDGKSDPNRFLTAFRIAMGRSQYSPEEHDAGYCQMFVESLAGDALDWFSKLDHNSIDSFAQLSKVFLKHYSMYIRPAATSADLYSIFQGRKETLRSYLERFKAIVAKVVVTDDVAIPALRNGLSEDSTFKDDLHINPPLTLEDALHRANKFAEVEDRRSRLRNQVTAKDYQAEKIDHKEREPQQHYKNVGRENRKAKAFNVNSPQQDRTQRQRGPNPSRNSYSSERNLAYPNKNAGVRYCEYHQSGGHWTSECYQLQRFLAERNQHEKPNRGGSQLSYQEKGKAIAESSNKNDDSQRGPTNQQITLAPKRPYEPTNDHLPPPRKRVNMIMGGLLECKDSVRSIKTYQREAGTSQKRQGNDGDDEQTRWDPIKDITFTKEDVKGVNMPHNDPLVVKLRIADCDVSRILIDTGSSVDLIFKDALDQMDLKDVQIKHSIRPLTGFDGDTTMTLGTVKLPVIIGGATTWIKFHVVDKPAIYNAILGTPWIYTMQAVVSTYHQCLKFPINNGVCTIRGNQQMARSCFIAEHKHRNQGRTYLIAKSSCAQDSPNLEDDVMERVEQVNIDPTDDKKCVGVGSDVSPQIKADIITFLKENVSTFAWSTEDMPGISTDVISHELNIDPTFKPVKQKRRKLGAEKARAVNEEVDRLLKAGYIEEVRYPEWLSNPVVVKKKNGKWRTCVDFTNLNKACPKDSFPVPRIDRLVESTSGNELLSFMDAFSGYNQIKMHPNDREKTSFITDQGIYCYRVMPFGLKNAGATYQRLVNKMFKDQIAKTMEVYIDDMLVKSANAEDHLGHLRTCFDTLNRYQMKLNPAKCTFAVKSGEFLGYMVTNRGIEANPKQIKAVMDLPSPRNKREVQRLTGRIAALNRFISRSTDKCVPFYKLLRNNKKFEWDEECEKAFSELKTYLSSPPILVKPEDGETLYLYISVTHAAISGVLVREDRGEQKPIFYVSKSLNDAETRYTTMEKLALAVVTAARKLRPYFQSHAVIVYSNHPIRSILHSPNQSGRLTKWAVELSEYDIDYKGRTSMKSQVLADFLVELEPDQCEEGHPDEKWKLFVDGSSSAQGSGVGIQLRSPEGSIIEQSFRLMFPASNNEAEYEALIAGLRLAQSLGVQKVEAYCDSQLVASQFSGDFEAKNDRMDAYLKIVQKLSKEFQEFSLTKIPRGENTSADALAALASTSDPERMRIIPVESIPMPSIDLPKGVCLSIVDDQPDEEFAQDKQEKGPAEVEKIEDHVDWRVEIRAYIADGDLPENKWAARRTKMRAARYALHKEHLLRRTVDGTLLDCIDGEEVKRVMEEVHLGAGGNHSGGRSLALKIRRLGYYWPKMNSDCEEYAKKCDKCQRHAPLIHSPAEFLATATTPYPFMRWGMDIIGPFPPSRQKRFILVLTDYFTKWVEADSFAKIKDSDVQKFVWKNVICRHGLPYEIVTDNGSQFISNKFEGFCARWRIRLSKSTPRHPQGNGLAEASNKVIINGLKKRLDEHKGKWADELDGVLWSYRTTPRSSTGKTPFALSHGMEALAPAEASVPTLRRTELPSRPELNNAMIKDALVGVEELRDQTLLKLQNYQQQAAKYYNARVRGRHFEEGDLVLRKVFQNTTEANAGKLGENWEGPYIITKVVKPGVYELAQMDGTAIPRSWNAVNLRRYYY